KRPTSNGPARSTTTQARAVPHSDASTDRDVRRRSVEGRPRTVNSLDTTIASLVSTNGAFSGSSTARPKISAGTDRHRCQDAHEVAAHHLDDVVGAVAALE